MKLQELIRSILLFFAIACNYAHNNALANPIGQWDQMTAAAPMFAYPQVPYANPMMMYGGYYDPYSMTSMQASPAHYYMQPQFPFAQSSMPSFDASPLRRSQGRSEKQSVLGGKHPVGSESNPEDEERKALGDLPVSFLEPDGPSTITERISDSFSALGEGFRNHFKSLTENFSDTVDDLKDVWRSSDSDKKRLG